MKVLQINTTVNSGSTGRIAEDLGRLLIENDVYSYIAYGRGSNKSQSEIIKVGNKYDVALHVLKSRIFDLHGFGSKLATRKLIKHIDSQSPDVIHLHNVHGYFLNIEILFNYLTKIKIPVVWTLHDCWPFTGHCSYFDAVDCYKWQKECNRCPNKRGYPQSWIRDNSKNNFYRKKALFTNLENLTIVTPSNWLAKHIRNSFLKESPVQVINNGIDLDVFKTYKDNKVYEKHKISEGNYILGVANKWDKRKGLNDFISLRELISPGIEILLVGLDPGQIKRLPHGIKGISRTGDRPELATLYSGALVYVNPTYVDNFPTTNIEALASGTPVITYKTGGSPESIDENTGIVIEKGNIWGLADAIDNIINASGAYSKICRLRAEKLFNKDSRYEDYLDLYMRLIKNK